MSNFAFETNKLTKDFGNNVRAPWAYPQLTVRAKLKIGQSLYAITNPEATSNAD